MSGKVTKKCSTMGCHNWATNDINQCNDCRDVCVECRRRKATKHNLCFVCIDDIKYGDERNEYHEEERNEE